jgi:hypothetical protein
MLSFQVINNENTVQICCDHKGMATLLEKLAARDPNHIHLRSQSSGGNELSETCPFGTPALREVIIDYQPDYSIRSQD